MFEEVICHEVELDWVKSFTALGINYDVTNLQGITELNCKTKMIKKKFAQLEQTKHNNCRQSSSDQKFGFVQIGSFLYFTSNPFSGIHEGDE